MKKRKKRGLAWLLSVLLGFVCALVLGVLFYAAMVYQLSGERSGQEMAKAEVLPPLVQGADVKTLFPGRLLTLEGTLTGEQAQDIVYAGEVCRVITRTYTMSDGAEAAAVSATPAAYFERMAQEGWTPQLITGFTLAGLDAVCEQRGEQSILAAQQGTCVYVLQTQADEQRLYALGAGAVLE